MLRIGQLAALTNVSVDTLRFYERKVLLFPQGKSAGGFRLYGNEAVVVVRFIKQAQRCGFSLSEVRELLELRASNDVCCGDVRRRAVAKKQQLEKKISAMKSMSQALNRLIANCTTEGSPIEECPILAALEGESPVLASGR